MTDAIFNGVDVLLFVIIVALAIAVPSCFRLHERQQRRIEAERRGDEAPDVPAISLAWATVGDGAEAAFRSSAPRGREP